MEKELNYCNGILIHNLREWKDAVKSLEKYASILSSSVVSLFLNNFGVNIVFDGYDPFQKAITKGFLIVNDVLYHIYPMVTNLTILGAYPFLDERTLKSLMKNIAPVLFVYREFDSFSRQHTNNFRVTLNHPEIYDIVNLWTVKSLQIPGNCTPFPIKLFCRLCRENGHTRHQCNKRIQVQTPRKINIRVSSYQDSLEKSHCSDNDTGNEHVNKPIHRKNTVPSYQDSLEKPHCSDNDTGNEHANKPIHRKNTGKDMKLKNRFLPLIPQELRIAAPQLKKFFLSVIDEKCSKNLCKKAELYPKGIKELLQHLKTVVAYNLKDMSNKSSCERRFIIFMDGVVGKINEELSKKNIEEYPVLNSEKETSNVQNPKFPSVDKISDGGSEETSVPHGIADRPFVQRSKAHILGGNMVTKNQDESVKRIFKNGSGNIKIHPKDLIPSTLQTTINKNQKKKVPSRLSPGFLRAIRCSKGILKSSELKAFLIHVRGRMHARQIAKIYSTEVSAIIEQLEIIVKKHYQGTKMITLTHREVAWLNELIVRLKAHENFNRCQNIGS